MTDQKMINYKNNNSKEVQFLDEFEDNINKRGETSIV